MKLRRRLSVYSGFLALFIIASSFSLRGGLADTKFRSQNVTLVVKGTSTLHDWEMKTQKGVCEVLFSLDNNDKITNLTGLSFSVPAESLKSEHTLMDNNTYKALKTGSFKNITFTLSSGTISQANATTYNIKAVGKLTIAGTSKETELAATVKYNPADKSFDVSGSKSFKMTEYGVAPPTVMFGTIKTGDAITVTFNTKIVR